MVFKGDPSEEGFSSFARFFYSPEVDRIAVYDLHDAFAIRLGEMGQNGIGLMDAYAMAFMELVNRKVAFA